MSSVFNNAPESQQQQQQQQPVPGSAPVHSYDPNQYQHMNQPSMQPGGYNNMRTPAMHPGMPAPGMPGQSQITPQPQNTAMTSHQPPHQNPHQPPQQQHQMTNSQVSNPPHSSSAMNPQPQPQPAQQTQPAMAPPASVQKLLDENNQYIQLLLDYQSKGKHQECGEYQRMLHRNLVYLATVADASNQNIQSSGGPPNIPLPPSTSAAAAPQSMNGNSSAV